MERPARLLLQWHLSDRCNLRCSHCYQEDYRKEERGLADWLRILDHYRALLRGPDGQDPIPGHINVTGGEPFAIDGLADLIEVFCRHRQAFSFGILSNGTLINRHLARQVREWGPRFVQISIEGSQETHDRIRGAGSYEQAVAGLHALKAEGVPTLIAFTALRDNWREFPSVTALGRRVGAERVWADRLIPAGQGQHDQVLDPDETRAFCELMAAEQRRPEPLRWVEPPRVATHRALQFLANDNQSPYHCTAGDTLLSILPDGTLLPCRRLPIPIGNVYTTPLAELYASDQLRQLRQPAWNGEGCGDCSAAPVCRGGLRCLSHALHGRLDRADPGCWLATHNE